MSEDNGVQIVEKQEDQLSIENFRLVKSIGRGSFGEVYLAQKINNNCPVAIKTMSKTNVIRKGAVGSAFRELNIMKRLNHPFVVKLLCAFGSNKRLYFVMEYVDGENFSELLEKFNLEEKPAKFFLAELYLAIKYLHESHVMHRDIKLRNLLYTCSGHLKICDFGLSHPNIRRDSVHRSFCGTYSNMAPEMWLKKGYTCSVDWWSFGIVLIEMLKNQNPFSYQDTEMTKEAILNVRFADLKSITMSPAARNLANGLLTTVHYRISPEEIAEHEFFEDLNWEDIEAQRARPPIRFQYADELDSDEEPVEDDCSDYVVREGRTDKFADFNYVNPSFQ